MFQVSRKVIFYNVFLNVYVFKSGLTRNKGSVILRPKIDKRNKRPLQISPPFE